MEKVSKRFESGPENNWSIVYRSNRGTTNETYPSDLNLQWRCARPTDSFSMTHIRPQRSKTTPKVYRMADPELCMRVSLELDPSEDHYESEQMGSRGVD